MPTLKRVLLAKREPKKINAREDRGNINLESEGSSDELGRGGNGIRETNDNVELSTDCSVLHLHFCLHLQGGGN